MKNRFAIIITASLFIGLFFSLLFYFDFFTSWRYKTIDKLYLPSSPNENIFIISIDNQSLQELGRWPWDRKTHAELIDKINQGSPAVIGVDVNFPETSNEESDMALALAIQNAGNVVLPAEAKLVFRDGQFVSEEYLFPTEIIRDSALKLGMTNTPTDQDGVFRRAPMTVASDDGKIYNHFVSEIAEVYLSKNQVIFPKVKQDRSGRMIFNYRGGPKTFPWVSARDVLEEGFDASIFYNKIVLIGATAPNLHDEQMVPTSSGRPMPGVEILSNGVDTIISSNFLAEISALKQVGIILFLAFLVGLSLLVASVSASVVIAIFVFFAYLIFALVLFDYGFILEIFYPFVTVVFVFLAGVTFKYFFETKEKQYIKNTFSRYVSEDVIEDILSDPKKLKLGGLETELSILFSDIRGFTTISEKLKPNELVKLMNDYLTQMSDIIMESQGVVDKYIGDAIMAFWGAPIEVKDHAEKACFSALKMLESLEKNKKEWKKQYDVDLDIGIGINTGEVIVGNMGSEQRFDYTAMGDNVNLASRLEGITKQYGVKIVISEFTYKQVRGKFCFRYLDKVAVKGKKEGVIIYELINTLEKISLQDSKLIEAFQIGVEMYQKRNWNEAINQFEKILSEFPDDGPSQIYLNRCKELRDNDPGQDWDGIFIMKTK